jgi:hypothetical protein
MICNPLWVRPYLPFFLSHLEPHSKPRTIQSVSLSQWFRIDNKDILPVDNKGLQDHRQGKCATQLSQKKWK